ncbi:MAG: anti-sigma factor [Haliscomenobacter sp.]|nr:anti-sigma factor [Haliscomenobacter sp.]
MRRWRCCCKRPGPAARGNGAEAKPAPLRQDPYAPCSCFRRDRNPACQTEGQIRFPGSPGYCRFHAGVFYAVWTRQSSQLRSLRQELASCEENQDNSRAVAQLFSQIAPKGTLPVTLQGTQLAPGSRSVVFWNPTKKTAWLNPGGLPAPPPGHQYQVWADVDGEMIPLGLIQPDGGDLHQIQYVSQAASLNITIEPLGGSDHPTVSKLMASGII